MNNTLHKIRPRGHQRGVSLFGLMFWAIVVGFVAYVAVILFPTVNEYLTIQSAVDKIAAGNPATVAEARAAFDRQREIEYSISSIAGRDLEITKDNDRVVIAFAYNKEVALFGPVYILLKYQGHSK
jgi:metal-dependent HD superfamily phosphatase/phosphodiesterase